MKISDYKQLKKQVEDRYKQNIALAEKERLEGLAAIDKVYNMLHPLRKKTSELPTSLEATETTESLVSSGYGDLAKAVKDSLRFVPETFTRNHVLAAIQQNTPEVANCKPSSLAGCLSKLVKKGVIVVMKKAQGRSAGEYRLNPHNNEGEPVKTNPG